MAISDFSNIDLGAVTDAACPPGTHWNGSVCVPDEVPAGVPPELADIDFEAYAAAYPDIFSGAGPPLASGGLSQNFIDTMANRPAGGGAPAADAAPAAPAVDWYEQTTAPGVVEAFISDRDLGTNLAEFGDLTDAQEAWLTQAIEEGIFVGNYAGDPALGYTMDQSGYVTDPETGRVVGPVGDPPVFGVTDWTQFQLENQDPTSPQFMDERYQGRIDFAESLLQQGYTVADIEQFLGVPSLGVAGEGFQDELGTVAGEMVDPSFAGVGSDQWFDFLEGQDIEVLPEHRAGPGSWFESPEFEAKYGNVDGTTPAPGAPPPAPAPGAPPPAPAPDPPPPAPARVLRLLPRLL